MRQKSSIRADARKRRRFTGVLAVLAVLVAIAVPTVTGAAPSAASWYGTSDASWY
jgi:hypothetical protein